MQTNLDLVPRSLFARLATRMFSKSVIPDAMQREAQRNGASQIRDLAPQPAHTKSRPPLLSYADIGQPIWAPRDYAAFAREGFMQNAVVYRCVRLIAENTAAVPLLLYAGDTEIEHHPLKTLLRAPHPTATYPDFMESFLGFLLVSGNAYIEAVSFGGEIRELHLLRPDRVKIVPGSDGWPEAYDYTVDGRTTRIEGEAAPGVRRVLHMRLFHPVNDHYGLSPIEAAACAIDLHNAAAKWNKALLDNSARPSGALVYTSRDGNLTPDQFDRLKSELEVNFQGTGNAGRPLLLEGGLDWKAMSMTPKDLDFVEAKNAAAREIALALGVPPLLLGIPGDNTYANYQEANSALWRQTIIPLVERIALQLGNWLCNSPPPRGEGLGVGGNRPGKGQKSAPLRLVRDTDQLPALAAERDALWKRLEGASFLTTNEKRIAAGYGANPNRLSEKVFNSSQPRDDQGRWTDNDLIRIQAPSNHDQFRVDLAAEEAKGGHTYQRHVGKTDAYLINRVETEIYRFGIFTVGLERAGTFPSLEAAEKLVSSTLANNASAVVAVASGQSSHAELEWHFSTPTGREAYKSTPNAKAYIRDTFGVRVYIVRDKSSAKGYRVHSSFPINSR